MLQLIALQLNARSVAIVNKKDGKSGAIYRFYLTCEEYYDINKSEVEIEFLKRAQKGNKYLY